jgi:tetratricopeptide (TPR) repeat protein
LSYRSVNRTWVLLLYDAFRQAGFKVFLDQLEIAAGNSLAGRLNDALQSSKSGVIVWSTDYGDSAWCLKEYETMEAKSAEGIGFKFLVAKLAGAKLPPLVKKDVYVDFSEYPDGPQGGELLKLMYGVLGKPLPENVLRAAQAIDDDTKATLTRIRAAREVKNLEGLRELAASASPAWQASPLLYSTTAEALIELGDNDGALTVLDHAGKQFAKAIRPIHLKALALARKGKLAAKTDARDEARKLLLKAQEMLAALFAMDHRDPETLGIYARTWMDLFDLTGETAYLEKSRDLYALGFKLDSTNSYTGVNAAAKSVFLDELDVALGYAKKVEALVGTEPLPGNYWESATVAEVQLIKRNYDRAAALYRKAVVDSPNLTANHSSTRAQAERLLAHLQPPPGAAEKILGAFKLGGGS